MELNEQFIKDVVMMNVLAANEQLLKSIHGQVRHIGNHISDRIGELLAIDPEKMTPADKAEAHRLDHLLTSMTTMGESVVTAHAVNTVGYEMVEQSDDHTPEGHEFIKTKVEADPNFQKVQALLASTSRKNSDDMLEAIREMLMGANPWNVTEIPLNGN